MYFLQGLMEEPVMAVCCKSFVGCKNCVDQWMLTSNQCLKCRADQFSVNAHRLTCLDNVLSILSGAIKMWFGHLSYSTSGLLPCSRMLFFSWVHLTPFPVVMLILPLWQVFYFSSKLYSTSRTNFLENFMHTVEWCLLDIAKHPEKEQNYNLPHCLIKL